MENTELKKPALHLAAFYITFSLLPLITSSLARDYNDWVMAIVTYEVGTALLVVGVVFSIYSYFFEK